jgi:glyoxylase-like metal-dependent hydrolase (beta-lactamase superfamily II)
MNLHLIETGTFKLDGGAMFGVVPKVIWQNLLIPDDTNRVELSMRCCLIETADRLILIDSGIGNKQKGKFIQYFSPENTHLLHDNLAKKGFLPDDITDVILTHLHFDHAGGAIRLDASHTLLPAFPRATYWVSDLQWKTALHPSVKEAPSFLGENFRALIDWGILKFVPCTPDPVAFLPGLTLRFVHGHSPGMMLPVIQLKNRTFVFCADLIPTMHHLSLSYIIAYDVEPLKTIMERNELIEEAILHQYILIFEHDPVHRWVTLVRQEDGKIKALPFLLGEFD